MSKQVVKRVVVDEEGEGYFCALGHFHPVLLAETIRDECSGRRCDKCRWNLTEETNKGDILTLYSDGTVGHEKGAEA